jgi:hypothetical protein
MRNTTSAIVLVFLLAFGAAGTAQQPSAPVTMSELLDILQIHVYRVHTPTVRGEIWQVQVVPADGLRPRGARPTGLSSDVRLFSIRNREKDLWVYQLPEPRGEGILGEFDLCKEANCDSPYWIDWYKAPIYSADGMQCVLAAFSNRREQPAAYIMLVRVPGGMEPGELSRPQARNRR